MAPKKVRWGYRRIKGDFHSGSGNRRGCDVLVCARFKYYVPFTSSNDDQYAEEFVFLKDGSRIVNFPKQHSANCTAKHQATNQWFKGTVRIYKNMRNYLIDNGKLREGVAPSYFIEGMLYNVPVGNFGKSWDDSVVNTFNHINGADRSQFKCANGIHPLLEANSHVSWNAK